MNKRQIGMYDKYIVMFSGGKDSLWCLLHLIDQKVDMEKIEIWHQEIDGREGSKLMDWPCTPGYCRAIARYLDLPLYFQWKVGGFEGEMTRQNQPTAPTRFEMPGGTVGQTGGNGKPNTRMKFPQISANLQTRWCSSALKIDVGAAALRNREDLKGLRTLVITGERAEESPGRAKYKEFEPHRADAKTRYIDHWRPALRVTEEEVWGLIQEHGIRCHPAYYLGFGRTSCQFCIFGSPNTWATNLLISPDRLFKLADYEEEFGVTLHRPNKKTGKAPTILDLAFKGTAHIGEDSDAFFSHKDDALDINYDITYFNKMYMGSDWFLPAGAFSTENCGSV